MAGFAGSDSCHALDTIFTDTFVVVDGNVESCELVADEGDRSVDTDSKSTTDTASACAQDENDVPPFLGDLQRLRTNDPFADEYPLLSTTDTGSACAQDENDVPWFLGDLQRLRTNDPFADEYPLLPGMLEQVATKDGFEDNDDVMSSPIARLGNGNAMMGWESSHSTIASTFLTPPRAPFVPTMVSPFMMAPFDTNPGSAFMMTPTPSPPFAASMGSPFMMTSPVATFAPTHDGVAYGSSPSVQPIGDVPAAPPAWALDRPCTYDWLETDHCASVHVPVRLEHNGLPCPLPGLMLTQSPKVLDELSPSLCSESSLPSSRLEIGSLPVSCVREDSCPLETKDTTPCLGAPPLCGYGSCQPCYNHIRGRCFNDPCAYCHMPIHAIRRKQKKHQRKAHVEIDSKSVDVCPQIGGIVTLPKAKCCAGNHHGEAQTATPCQPCFKHIRGQCFLGAGCLYCHDKIHVDRQKQKKLVRSAQRLATRKMETNSLKA